MRYKTIYADPPWPEHGGGKIKRGADKHYNLMTVEEIIGMKDLINTVSEDDCHLYLWVTNNFLEDGLLVMKEWGFKYKTIITWVKTQIGLGQYFRGLSEHCLFGVKGNLPYKTNGDFREQGVTAFIAEKTKHSEKPLEMRKMIETVSYPPYLELFARDNFSEWVALGKEVPSKKGFFK